jgi:HD-like signal output (HDOD) protein
MSYAGTMLTDHQRKWGVEQWVVFLKDKEIPILPRTRMVVQAVAEASADRVSPKEMAGYVFSDPYLTLKMLRQAEQRRSKKLGHDTTTALGTVMQAGIDGLLETVSEGPLTDDSIEGLANCEFRAVLAANIARQWASARADVSPEEVAMAALLSETGELLLWYFATELPQLALDNLHSGRALRTNEAQDMACGFVFKQLTIALIDAWQLPQIIKQMIRGADTLRANIARLATDTARHIVLHPENPAIPSDIVNIKALLPGTSHQDLIACLPITPEYKELVLSQIAQNSVAQEPR